MREATTRGREGTLLRIPTSSPTGAASSAREVLRTPAEPTFGPRVTECAAK